MKQALQRIPLLLLAILTASYSVAADTKPIRVFVLAGQSNMEGAGLIKADPKRNGGQGSLEFLVKDAATAKHFAFVIAETGMGGPEETQADSSLKRNRGSRKHFLGGEVVESFAWSIIN